MPYKLAIFDFDGTLVDSAPGIVQVMEQVVKEYNLPQSVFEEWRHLVGVPLNQQIEMILPEQNDEFRNQLASRYRAIYDTKVIEICPPFPQLKEMLGQLKSAQIQMAIASSKRRNLIDPVLSHHNLSEYFQMVVGQHEVTNHKPHPESVHQIAAQLEIKLNELVVVGDSSYDMEMARQAGADSIGVLTGIHTREILLKSKPLYIVEGLHQVTPLILNGRLKKQI